MQGSLEASAALSWRALAALGPKNMDGPRKHRKGTGRVSRWTPGRGVARALCATYLLLPHARPAGLGSTL